MALIYLLVAVVLVVLKNHLVVLVYVILAYIIYTTPNPQPSLGEAPSY
jgi:phage shock protein PspC (stress-responsive transcriptional regulator)